mgnify:CR=1 FL=1
MKIQIFQKANKYCFWRENSNFFQNIETFLEVKLNNFGVKIQIFQKANKYYFWHENSNFFLNETFLAFFKHSDLSYFLESVTLVEFLNLMIEY